MFISLPENENITTCDYPDDLKHYSIKSAPFTTECHSKLISIIAEDLYIDFNSSLNNLTWNSGNVLVFSITIA